MKEIRFIDKDPIVDGLREKVGVGARKGDIARLAGEARLAPSTIMNIFYGKTRRPQNHTVDQILKATGWRRVLVRDVGR